MNQRSGHLRSGFHPARRRRGQMLLLAVLLMVFVALLGSTFITVVSLNLSQTARHEDKERARAAAQAAFSFADSQLVHSAAGDKWRPELENPPPAPDDDDYNFYYTPLDQAQGWARTVPRPAADDERNGEWDGAAPAETSDDDRAKLEFYKSSRGARVFVKFPDPRHPTPDDAPVFLLEVQTVNSGDKRGMLHVSTIGLSQHNPSVFERRVAFKSGPVQNPLTGAARAVTNWDFERQEVPSAQIDSVSSTNLALRDVKTPFPTGIGAFYVMIGDPVSAVGVRGAVVASASVLDTTNRTQILTLAGVPAPALAPGERVEMAAGLGAPTRIDYNFDGVLTPGVEKTRFQPSESGTPGSVWINGGLLWFGNALMDNLRSPEAVGDLAGAVRVSGLIDHDNSDTANQPTLVQAENIKYQDGAHTRTLSTAILLPSDNVEFPFDAATVPAQEKSQLVNDGWSRLAGDAGGTQRQVQPIAPPDITGRGEDIARYRALSKFSAPTSGDPTASFYGAGAGIYIDNRDDQERVYDTSTSRMRDMTPDETQRMWLDANLPPANQNRFLRRGTPQPASSAAASLEEQHLRGWIGPDEFRGRGALIELMADDPATIAPGDAVIAITRDARADGSTPDPAFPADPPDNIGPARHKAWKDPATGAVQPGIYTRVFPWPANGVIFAEGNLRVKGEAATAPRSLTIVSMGNIYIEGSLHAGKRKVLLLARQNVVLNPTGVLARVEAQTRLNGPPTGNDLPVADAAAFLPGDWLTIDGFPDQPRRVASVSANTLGLSEPAPSSVLGSEAVRAVSDPLNGALPRTDFSRLGGFDDTLQRRFQLPSASAASSVRLTLRHSAERVAAWTLGADDANPPFNPNPLLGIKVVPPASGSGPLTNIIQTAQKTLDVPYTDASGTSGRDRYPLPPGPTSQTEATAISIADLRAAMLDFVTGRPAPSTPLYPWFYTSPPIAPGLENVPFFFLAGVGNRNDLFNGIGPQGSNALRRNLITGGDYEIPLATSVEIALDGTRSSLRGDRWNADVGDFERVLQFGFNPTHGAGLSPSDPATWEDVLTTDQSFYTANANRHTLDSRVLAEAGAGLHSLAMRFVRQSGQPGDAPIESYFSGDASLPAYRVARLKLENENQSNAAPNFQFETLKPGYTLDVRAFVYAQEGSWIVIPGAFFDDSVRSMPGVRGTYVETDDPPNGPTAGEFLDTAPLGVFSDGDYADLDRDGVISRSEQAAPYRFGRSNYKITFSGAITEHHTALVRDPDGSGPLTGAVADWTDKWSTVSLDAENWDGPGASDAFRHNLSAVSDDFGGITYRFDDAAARGFFDLNGNGSADPGESVHEDAGFRAPVTPGFFYQ